MDFFNFSLLLLMIKSILVFCYKKKKYFSFGMNNVDLDFNLPLVSQKKKKKILFCLLNYSIKKKSKHNAKSP